MKKGKLYKAAIGGVIYSFLIGGCTPTEKKNKEPKIIELDGTITNYNSYEEMNKADKEKILKEIPTAKVVESHTYNGVKANTLVNDESIDLLLMLAYYDAMDSVLSGKDVNSYKNQNIGKEYYSINYRAFEKEFESIPTKEQNFVSLNNCFNNLIDKWNAWDLTMCTEEEQKWVASETLKQKDTSSTKYDYLSYITKDCKDTKTSNGVPSVEKVHMIQAQEYYLKDGTWQRGKQVEVVPDYELVCQVKLKYYQRQEQKYYAGSMEDMPMKLETENLSATIRLQNLKQEREQLQQALNASEIVNEETQVHHM